MKKILPILLIMMMLLTACSTGNTTPSTTEPPLFPIDFPTISIPSSQNTVYDVQILASGTLDNDSVFKNTFLANEVATGLPAKERIQTPTQYTVKLGSKSIVGTHAQNLRYSYGDGSDDLYHVFLNATGDIEYRVSANRNAFYITKAVEDVNGNNMTDNSAILSAFEGNDLSEQALLTHVRNYISDYIDITTLEDYIYTCTTSVIVSKPSAAWKETIDSFYIPANETSDQTERVTGYDFKFYKHHNGYQTGDCVIVFCKPNGDIYYMYYNDYDIDWNRYPIDNTLLNQNISTHISQAVKDRYTIKTQEMMSQQLIYQNGKIKLSCVYGLTLTDEDGEIDIACPLMITLYTTTE